MSALLFDELLNIMRAMIREELDRFRADLSRSTGVLPPTQLPGGGNTGGGYSPAAHASTHAAGGSDELTPAAIGAAADDDPRLSDSRTPTGGAGGALSGSYPNPGFAVDMATQGELDTHAALTTSAHGGIVASTDPRLTDARTPTAHATSHQHGGGDEIATATPGANAIPKAGSGGTIADGWLSSLIARVADIVTHAAVVTGVHGLVNSGPYTFTIPATGTAALRDMAQTFTAAQTIAATLVAQQIARFRTTSGGNGYGLRFSDGTTDYGNFQVLDLGSVSYIFFATNRQFDGSAWQQLNARVGGSFQVENGELTFVFFPASSTTPAERLRMTANGTLLIGRTSGLTGAGDVDAGGNIRSDKALMIKDGISAPSATAGYGTIYIDSADGDLKIKFADGTVKTIVVDT